MRSILFLLFVSLMKGCEAKAEPNGCLEGWAEFASKKPKLIGSNTAYPSRTDIRSTKKDEWENKVSISLYHDTINKTLMVTINQCKSTCTSDGEELILVVEKDGCPGPFNQTVYTTDETTITCDYPGKKNKSSVKFFCKDNDLICEDILSTNSSSKSNGTFTLTETSSDFSISISNVSKGDAGVYWCGAETSDGRYRAALRSIKLKVEEPKFFKRSPPIGQNFTYFCTFHNDTPKEIFICKGEDPSICPPLVTSTQPDKTGKFSMKKSESKGQRSKTDFNVSITVREVTANDSGIYWCGAESKDKTRSNVFFHKFSMTVVPTPTPTSGVSSTELNTSTPAEDNGGSNMLIPVTVSVAVLLLFVLILIIFYKRFTHSKNTRNGATAQDIKEDNIYAEIQAPASVHYSTIVFKNSSNKAGGDKLIVKPRSACEYSTVKHSDSPVYYTVNKPSTSSQDPLYSTVSNKW
ncbi:uncharacterized protein LOC115583238 [Sparus aurata]|uniref:uncharacterized protein LOC115583238 n=1 Tax=Sparus aurata TaxID=8175 RepID=UPI0011C1B4D7|nr:uncharacterized protein LOC115583238 [Sparus aurata]